MRTPIIVDHHVEPTGRTFTSPILSPRQSSSCSNHNKNSKQKNVRTTTKNSTTTTSTEIIKTSYSPRIVTLSRNLPSDYYSGKKFGNLAYRKSPVINVCPNLQNEQYKETIDPAQKQTKIVNLANVLDSKLRKDFMRKQQQLRKPINNDDYDQIPEDSPATEISEIKPKPTIISYPNSVNSNQPQKSKQNSSINSQNKTGQSHKSIVINFEKYKVNKPDDTNKPNLTEKKMLNKPAAPRKHHTFNENQSPYHKDAKNKLLLNQNKASQDPSKPNVDVIYFKKPITRTGSTLMSDSSRNVPKSIPRRQQPKEFLSTNGAVSPREPIDLKQHGTNRTVSRESFYSRESHSKEEIINNDFSNRTLSPTAMKSLPSYDEALKRASETQGSKKIPVQQSTYSKSHAPVSKSIDININGSSNQLLKNRTALPNLHSQSNFKSLLLTTPNNNGLITNNTSSSNATNGSNRVYFRPQDLNSNNRLIQLQQTPSLSNITESSKTENELFLLQKNSLERINNGSNATTSSSNKITIKKINSPSPQPNSKSDGDLIKNFPNQANNGSNILISASPIEGNSPSTSSELIKSTNLPNLIPKITSAASPPLTTYDFQSSTKVTQHQNKNSTTTTKTIEQINTVHKSMSNANTFNTLANVNSPTNEISANTHFTTAIKSIPISNSNSGKLKSWSNVNNSDTNGIKSPRDLPDPLYSNRMSIRERTPTPENRNFSPLTSWKSTATNNDKQIIVMDNSKDLNNNFSSNYDKELFSPRDRNQRSDNRMMSPRSEKSTQEIPIQLSPGKLMDAVKAASNNEHGSIENGLALINEFNKNTQALISEFKTNTVRNSPRYHQSDMRSPFTSEQIEPAINNAPQQPISNQRVIRNKRNSLEDTFSSSLSSCSESESISNKKKNSNDFLKKMNQKPQEEDYFLDEISTMNDLPSLPNQKNGKSLSSFNTGSIITKKSVSTENNLNSINSRMTSNNRFFSRNNSEENVIQRIPNISKDDRSCSRPRGRLNFYDSDTFSENFLINGSHPIKSFKKNDIILSDSPGLSDLSEDLNGGHRTSTPNMSKNKRFGNTPELKFIKKQIEDLEKMYGEIIKMIEPEKLSNISKGSLESICSNSSTSSHAKRSNNRKLTGIRSNSHRSQRNDEIKFLKHRFNRMESNLIQLAKTVAQISVELKSMKSIEDVIINLTKDVQELQRLNLGLSNSSTKPGELYRSTSEPRQFKTDELNKEANKNSHNNAGDMVVDLAKRKSRKDDNLRVPAYTNPRKLKKLTKFFGQEPPMLRLFLQKLNYEMYASHFENEHITLTELPYLSEERLKTIGIPLGPRIRILQEAQMSFKQDNLSSY